MKKDNHYLQRLLAPPGFGAGMGIDTFRGLDREDVAGLFKIVRFDYMAANQYEQGKIPISLHAICTGRPEYKLHKRDIKGVSFYILIPEERLDEYVAYIEKWSEKNDHIEYHGLKDIIEGNNPHNIEGWLDIDEHVAFFLNEEMATHMDAFLYFKEEQPIS